MVKPRFEPMKSGFTGYTHRHVATHRHNAIVDLPQSGKCYALAP